RRVSGKRLGIVGMGRIGAAVAKRARAFNMSVHYHNRARAAASVEEETGATYWQSLDQMLANMDVVSVHCPQTPATFHLLSARRLALLRPEAVLINTARGDIVDEDALTAQIEADKLAGAALDVYSHAPAVDERLLALQARGKAVLLPHMGSATIEGRIDMGEKVIINIRTALDGHRPPDMVLPEGTGVHRKVTVP
ncbi:MAG: NAD(P)-dependent oxidoreductase, partial [Pseudomonadota bacterium]